MGICNCLRDFRQVRAHYSQHSLNFQIVIVSLLLCMCGTAWLGTSLFLSLCVLVHPRASKKILCCNGSHSDSFSFHICFSFSFIQITLNSITFENCTHMHCVPLFILIRCMDLWLARSFICFSQQNFFCLATADEDDDDASDFFLRSYYLSL